MKIPYYQIDAFTDHQFGGNPAGICPLDRWLSAETMQLIGMENNLAETAFFVKESGCYHIRWFTPAIEVELCGHATLATAFVIFEKLGFSGPEIKFTSLSGPLFVKKKGDLLTLDFPKDTIRKVEPSTEIIRALGFTPVETWKGKTDWMVVLPGEKEIADYKPDITALSKIDCRGIIITARGDHSDFVSRFFGPQAGVPEDPVTGSAHTTLAPYWAEKLGKTELSAIQLSQRKGHLLCRVSGDRVEISGQAKIFLSGEIEIEGNT
jgi:PhzF family phenazine biosynthesis protein